MLSLESGMKVIFSIALHSACPGTNNEFDLTYDQVRTRFEGCEVVQGNLELFNLPAENGTNRTYDFLSSIREISGYLAVRGGQARELPLENLAVIRGERLLPSVIGQPHSLLISGVPYLQSVRLNSLGDILAGTIGVFSAPNLCHFTTSILWSDIVRNDSSRSTPRTDSSLPPLARCKCDCIVDMKS